MLFIDISIFIGARSDVNESNWFWNNGKKINDPDFPPSDPSVCQQMTWPLSYEDGINLRPKRCDQGESYYVCDIKCKKTINTSVEYILHFVQLDQIKNYDNVNSLPGYAVKSSDLT